MPSPARGSFGLMPSPPKNSFIQLNRSVANLHTHIHNPVFALLTAAEQERTQICGINN